MAWRTPNTLEELRERAKNTLGEFLEMEFVEIGDDYLKMRMPVISKTKQPMGLLHGGATAALAETIGSICSHMSVHQDSEAIVGLELNINHIKAMQEGWVYATCRPFHIGRTTHIWNIEIRDEQGNMVSISRLTTMTIKRRH